MISGVPSAHSGLNATPAPYVFIVGLPRTGSTLTRAILNRSSQVRLAGETHFLTTPHRAGLGTRRGYAERFRAVGDLRTDRGLEGVVAAIYRSRGKSFWTRLSRSVDRDTFEAALRATDRSDRALFDTAMRLYAEGRAVAGDKTPEHIYVVPKLLEWFPDARVIHTFRDPRAIYVSIRKKESPDRLSRARRLARRAGPVFDLYSAASLVIAWRRVVALHRRYEQAYPDRYRLVRFEDLLAHPERLTRELCTFVGLPFEREMLDQTIHNSSYLPRGIGGGIDPAAADRWRDHLSLVMRRWFSMVCGTELVEFGYDQ